MPPPAAVTVAPQGGAEEEDPFEATRKRIERLKAEGALPVEPQPAGGLPLESPGMGECSGMGRQPGGRALRRVHAQAPTP